MCVVPGTAHMNFSFCLWVVLTHAGSITSLLFAAKVIIHQTLSVLEDIVESISGESTKSRQICYQSLQESVQVSLALFPAFIHQSGITIGQV